VSWENQVASIHESGADWRLPGFIYRGKVTLLTSMWKAGKTTPPFWPVEKGVRPFGGPRLFSKNLKPARGSDPFFNGLLAGDNPLEVSIERIRVRPQLGAPSTPASTGANY